MEIGEPVQEAMAALMAQIAARYTMAREREIHRMFLPDGAGAEGAAEMADTSADDDDLFDDGLF